jgi:hypothetical protein
MSQTALFLGLVTHGRSRFRERGEETVAGLDARLAALGVPTRVLVSDRDDYDPEQFPLGSAVRRRSAQYQADLEYRWRRYLGVRKVQAGVLRAAMVLRRRMAMTDEDLVRLLNIDLSHLRCLDEGVASGSPWLLIVEDDARLPEPDRAAEQLAALLAAVSERAAVLGSLSQSIDLRRLGVEHLLAADDSISVPGLTVLAAAKPITNTVCATLYRADFAASVADSIRSRGLVPVAPIDWRLNEAILSMVAAGTLDRQSCVWTEPGLFVQGSMHG